METPALTVQGFGGHFHTPSVWPDPYDVPGKKTTLAEDYYFIGGGPPVLTGSIALLSGFEGVGSYQEESVSNIEKILSGSK